MGWTWTQGKDGKSTREYCDKLYTWNTTNEQGTTTRKVLKSAMKGSTYYAAVETVTPDGTREVWGAVCLTKSTPRAADGYVFGYKEMDETVGPCEKDCPAGILDLLTPTDREWALQWRAGCRANLLIANKPKPVEGQTIKLATPMRFTDGQTLDTFKVTFYMRRGKRMTAYRSTENGGLYRLTNVNKLAYEVLP